MSRTLRSASPLLLLSVLVGLASCGRSGAGTATAPAAMPLLHLLHPNTPIVAHYDFDGLRRSPYYDSMRELVDAGTQGQREQVEGFFRVLDHTDHVVVGFEPFGGGPDETLVAMRGAFEPRHLEAISGFHEAATYRTHELRGSGSDWMSVPTADTALLGQLQEVHDALDRLDGVFPGTGPTRPGFAEAAALAQLGERDCSMVWVFTDEMRAELGQGHVEHVLHENGVSAGGWFSLRDGLQLEAFITTNEAAAVPVLAHALREALTEAEENPVLVALGATTVLQQVTLHEEDTTFRVTLSVTDAQVRELLANALRLVQSASVD
ncbi:MAG: hypothetical protein R3B40_04760 [Polyangiales bacterium]